MANIDYEQLISQLKNANRDPKAAMALGRLSQVLKTEEGKQLAQEVIGSASKNTLNDAVKAVQSGDMESAKQSFQKVMSNPQGASAISAIIDKLK